MTALAANALAVAIIAVACSRAEPSHPRSTRLPEPAWPAESSLASVGEPVDVPAGNWLVAPQRPEWAAIRDRIGAEFPDVRAVVICTNGTLDVEHYFAGATARTEFN